MVADDDDVMTNQLAPQQSRAPQAMSASTPVSRARPLPIWLRAVLGPISLGLAYLLIMVVYSALMPAIDPSRWTSVFGLTIAQSVSLAVVAVLFIAVLTRTIERRPLRTIGLLWTARSIPMLLIGVVTSVAVVLITAGLTTTERMNVDLSQLEMPLWAGIVLALVAGFVLQAFPEELAFRGYLLSVLGRRPVLAAVVSSVLFGSIHLISNGGPENALDRFIYLLPAAAFGLTAAALALVTRSLWASVGVHGGMHTGFLVCQFFGLVAGGRPYWLASAGLHLVIAIALLVIYKRRNPDGVVRYEN